MEKFDIEHDEPTNMKQPESVYEITWQVLVGLAERAEKKMQTEVQKSNNG